MNLTEHQAKVDALAEKLNESTGLSWLWAFLFGPIFFIVNGMYRHAAIIFLLNLVLIGIIVAPFMAYPAHRAKARARAEAMVNAGVEV